jgi:hypothetical protein
MLVQKIINMLPSSIKTRSPIKSTELTSNLSDGSMDIDYLSRIGCLLYLLQGSRPDITFAVNFLARFSMRPNSSHWPSDLEYLMSYVQYSGLLSLPIVTSKRLEDGITTYVDANWGGKGAQSVHGFISLAWGAPISWASKQKTCFARSTCQAEYMGLSFASKEATFLASFLSTFFSLPAPLILCDNKAAVHISSDCATRKQHQHVDCKFHTTNELLYQKKVQLEWIKTSDQLADIFTKALGWRLVSRFLNQTGLRPMYHTLASTGGEVCASCDKHTPPTIVRLNPAAIQSHD